MFGSSKTVYLHFLGWRYAKDRATFHDSPEYFENIWMAEGIPGKPKYPVGMINVHQTPVLGQLAHLKVLFDPSQTTIEKLIADLTEAGLLVEHCQRLYWWSRCGYKGKHVSSSK